MTRRADRIADEMARGGRRGWGTRIVSGPGGDRAAGPGTSLILANPCNPRTLETINPRVKFREPIRPLAPMATLARPGGSSSSPGGADDEYNAYSYMVLTARAGPMRGANSRRGPPGSDWPRANRAAKRSTPLLRLSKAMGRRLGVEYR